jgi:hypothetical protein
MLNVPGARLTGVAETRARQVRMVGQYMLSWFLFLTDGTEAMGSARPEGYIPIRVVGIPRGHPLSAVTRSSSKPGQSSKEGDLQ